VISRRWDASQLRRLYRLYASLRPARTLDTSGRVLTLSWHCLERQGTPRQCLNRSIPCRTRSGSEGGHQFYKQFGTAKLDGVDLEGVPADEV
jgi:hypothetical protein